MCKMLNDKRAKFTLVNGITPEDYQDKMFKEFIELTSKTSLQKNEMIKKYLYEKYTEALKKVEQ